MIFWSTKIKNGVLSDLIFVEIKKFCELIQVKVANLAVPVGFEPTIFWMRTRYPRPLDDGTILNIL